MNIHTFLGYEIILSKKYVIHQVLRPGDGIEIVPSYIKLHKLCGSRQSAIDAVNKFFDEVEKDCGESH